MSTTGCHPRAHREQGVRRSADERARCAAFAGQVPSRALCPPCTHSEQRLRIRRSWMATRASRPLASRRPQRHVVSAQRRRGLSATDQPAQRTRVRVATQASRQGPAVPLCGTAVDVRAAGRTPATLHRQPRWPALATHSLRGSPAAHSQRPPPRMLLRIPSSSCGTAALATLARQPVAEPPAALHGPSSPRPAELLRFWGDCRRRSGETSLRRRRPGTAHARASAQFGKSLRALLRARRPVVGATLVEQAHFT